jgi:hypothetical protein
MTAKQCIKLAVGALALAGAGVVLSGPPVGAAGNPNPGVLPPSSHPYGKSYGEWANSWWQWADSIPMSVNPLIDPTGANCAQGQSGQVWFLAGSPSGSYDRSCTVPAGKAVFFPVANFQEDQREAVPDYAFFGSEDCDGFFGATFCDDAYALLSPDPTDPAAMFAFIQYVVDAFVDPDAKFATLDGVDITDLGNYRAPSGPAGYTINLPDTDEPFDNYHSIFGYAFDGPDTYTGVQDGYYLMLKPLTPGEHTLSFGEAPGWVITYELTVE